jgi:Fe-S oxidoreductase
MIGRTLALWCLVLVAAALVALRASPIAGPLLRAPADSRFDQARRRWAGVARAVGLHERLLQRPLAGTLHAMIFTSFFVLATAIIEAFGSGLIPGFSLDPIGGQSWIALLQDVFAVLMLAGVGLACWQRFVIKPARFRGSNQTDATIIYGLICAIVLSMLLEASLGIVAGQLSGAWRPVAEGIARLLIAAGLSPEAAGIGRELFFWVHVCAILGFAIYIPGSKHRHMFTAAPNVYFRSLAPKGQSAPVPEGRKTTGVTAIEQFSWKEMLDMVSCTECGRCQAACPAYASGLPLSPKTLIMDLRDHMVAKEKGETDRRLIGTSEAPGAILEQTLWACTTCRACMEVCPVNIEHLPKIVDMRRTLVDEGHVEPMLQDALSNLQRTGNSMGKSARMRARWTKDLSFKIKDARKEPVDILWFVGDFASFDPRAQKTTLRVAELLHQAGVDFGLLYEAEQNSGNDVRRVGEEGLFETLGRANIEAIEACSFSRIVTTDPHSLNALRNEYQSLGATFEVLHYTELLSELVASDRLKLRPQEQRTVTYHDPCYLGRYNGGFDAPRDLIRSAGHKLHDMPRCRENSFCCGAGGGRIWMDDSAMTERPSENRIKEALALGDAGLFVVACPKDKVMYSAAVQNLGVSAKIEVVDIVDLIEVKERVLAV